MVAEPLPSPISKLPKPGDAYGAGIIPAPTDQDLAVALVLHPHKLGANQPGWVAVRVPLGVLIDLPINTADSIGLINQVQAAMAASLSAANQADKSRKTAQNAVAAIWSLVSAATSWAADAMKWARRARDSQISSIDGATRAAGFASLTQSKLNATRRQFSDSNLAGFIQSNVRIMPPRVPRANNSNSILANQVFGN